MTGKPEQIPDEVVAAALKAQDDTRANLHPDMDECYTVLYQGSGADTKEIASGGWNEIVAFRDRLAMRAALSVYEAYRSQLIPIPEPKEATNGLD